MGCCGSSTSAVGLQGASAKAWLKIPDVPASVQVVAKKDGTKGLSILVAGMDRHPLVGVLERAFRCRGFEIESGEWNVQGSLFHAVFNLCPVANKRPQGQDVESDHSGELNRINSGELSMSCGQAYTPPEQLKQPAGQDDALCQIGELSIQFCDVPTSPSKKHVVEGLSCAGGPVPRVELLVRHTMGEELHVGLLSVVQQCGGRTVRAVYERPCADSMEKDLFWIDGLDTSHVTEGVLSSPAALLKSIREHRRALEEAEEIRSITTGVTMPPETPNTTLSLLNALRVTDRRALQQQVLELPVAIMHRVSQTPYEIKASSWGHQVQGYQKYMGAGIVMDGEKAGTDEAPILEFTTLVIQNKNVAHVGAQRVRRSLTSLRMRAYGEFINSIDVNRRRFTIERVFSNNVCPTGKKFGSVISAEQLFAPIWEKGASGLGVILPIHKIQEIKLSDVVNWNTYAVLCTALFERGDMDNIFGEHFEASLDEELRIAKLTRSTCRSLSMVEVFSHTILGKFTLSIIDQWRQRTSVCLKLTDVEVSFRDDGKEFIAGEERAAMDVICKTKVEYAISLSMSPTNEGRACSPPELNVPTEPVSPSARDALQQWMMKTKATHLDTGLSPPEGNDVEQRSALVALVSGIQALQEERGLSCLAVADGMDDRKEESLNEQRGITDARLVHALELTTSPIIRSVSGSLILLRILVDQSVGSEWSWEDRYKYVCTEPRTFNILIGMLVECLIDACKRNPDIPESSVESIGIFSYFAEQLGRERAFVLCHGSAKAVDPCTETNGMHKVVRMSATRALIGDMLQIDTRFTTVVQKLQDAEAKFLADEDHDPETWFNLISVCIGLLQNLTCSLIQDTKPAAISDKAEVVNMRSFMKGENFEI